MFFALTAFSVLTFADLPLAAGSVELTPQTRRAFNRYVERREARIQRGRNQSDFLYAGPTVEQRAKLRSGDVLIVPEMALDHGKEIGVPGGLVQDWLGLLFIPRATVANVRAAMQNYAAYKNYYKPEVIASKAIAQNGNEYDIFLRLYKRQLVTVVLNANYHVTYGEPDADRMWVDSRSTRIAEVSDPAKSYTQEEPVGRDSGFLWALNSYWRFEQADGGVYAQLEAISLSRDLPFGLLWLKGFIQKFPKDSMEATLRGTKRAVLG